MATKNVIGLCMRFLFIILTIVCEYVVQVSSQDQPIVQLPKGTIKGTFELNSIIGKFSVFRGIPYAKPPTETLRFKDPEEPDPWSSPLSATEFKPICPQWDNEGKIIGNEDCLYLNVYSPAILRETSNNPVPVNPVMIFFHGGNFQKGSSNPYNPEKFTEKSIVLVTFNYRLGILGFLSTGDESCSGNWGLKDQVMVLKWVKENIDKFGGDPNLITIFGQGAGAASVFLHIISPQSKGLFQHAITQSGSPFCDWTFEENPFDYAQEVAQNLQCTTKSTAALTECIRGKPVDKILYAQKSNKTFGIYPLRVTPVIEKEGFLSKSPEEILNSKDFQPVPLITGLNKDDGAIFYSVVNSYQESLAKNSSFLKTQLLPMFLLTATDIRGNIESVSEALMFHYFNGIDSTDVTKVLQPFINMSTDALFLSCNFKTLEEYTKTGALAYMYSFEYRGKHSMLDLETGTETGYPGVSHGDELIYLFNITNDPNLPYIDNSVVEKLLHLWTTFAKTGKSPEEITAEFRKWDPYTNELKNYYEIRKDLLPKKALKQREVDLWLHHLPSLSKIVPAGIDETNIQYVTGSFGWAMFAITIILAVFIIILLVVLCKNSKGRYFKTRSEAK